MIVKFFSFLFLFTLPCVCTGQSKEGDSIRSYFHRKFRVKELRNDFNMLRQGLEKAHAGLYRYTSPADFDSIFSSAEKALNHPMSLMEFYSVIGPVVAATREDHTDIELPAAYDDYYKEYALLFPFNCKVLDGHVYITENLSADSSIKAGWEILAINNRPIDSICNSMFRMFAADGFILTSKYRELDEGGFRGNYFRVFGDAAIFDLELKDTSSVIFSRSIQAQTLGQISPRRKTKEDEAPLYFTLLDNGTALLKIATFSNSKIRSAKQNYPSFLDSCFKILSERNIPALIVDVRENGGGTEGNENLLFSYMAKENFRKYKYVEALTNKIKIDTENGRPVRHKVFGLEERIFQNYKTKEGHLRRRNKGKLSLMAFPGFPDYRYAGKVYVLVSGVTYSGGSEFSNMMYHQDRAIFIGEESGGGYYGNTSGYSFDLRLPATGMMVSIPLLHFEMNVKGLPDGRGVIPHYTVIPSIRDHLQGRDIELDLAKKLASEHK